MTTVFDYKADLLQDTVATAPIPALSGTTITPTTPSLFPDPASVGAYDVYYIASLGIAGNRTTVEKLRFTAKSGSQYTITRAQGVTTAKPIAIAGILYIAPTSKHFTDLETAVNTLETNQTEIEVDIVDLESYVTYLNQLVFNVKSYGAIGDGVANDSTAVQAAITAAIAVAGTVYFPPGTYKIVTGLSVPNTASITLKGASWGSILTGTASVLLTVLGTTTIGQRALVSNMTILITGAQTAVKYSGTWSAAGNSGLAFDHCYIHGTGTSTQILIQYVGMQSTCMIRDCVVTNNTNGNDCTALDIDGATSAVMGLRLRDSTFLGKRAVRALGSGAAPNDVEGLVITGCQFSGVTYAIRVDYCLDVQIADSEFTGGGTCIYLGGSNNTVRVSNTYFDVALAAPIVVITTASLSSSNYIKFSACHFEGNSNGDDGIFINTLANGVYDLIVTGCNFHNLRTAIDVSTGVSAGEFAGATITGNTLNTCTTGIAMGTSATKRVVNTITGNTFLSVTTPYSGQRIGNTIVNNTNDLDLTWTPTITAGNAGAITAVSCAGKYHQIDPKHWWIQFTITMTTNGAGGVYLICPIPTGLTGAAFDQVIAGLCSNGTMVWGSLSSGASAINMQTFNAGYPGVNGTTITLTGVIEVA